MELIGKIYDVKKWQFKNLVIPILVFTILMIIFFTIGIFVNLPNLLLPSLFALAIAIISVIHNHWILNSIVTPFAFLFTVVSIVDTIHFDIFLMIAHIPTAVISITILFRLQSSLIVMLCTSFFYAMWIYTIMRWFPFATYHCILSICEPFWQAVVVFAGCGSISVITSVKNVAASKLIGKQIECDGGICPL